MPAIVQMIQGGSMDVSGPKWEYIFLHWSPEEAAEQLLELLGANKPKPQRGYRKRSRNEQSTDGSNEERNRPKCLPRSSWPPAPTTASGPVAMSTGFLFF